MKKAIKLKLYPDPDTALIIDSQMKMTNFLYNKLLENANDLRQQFAFQQNPEIGKTLYSKRGLRNLVPKLKQEHPFLKTVHSSPLKNAALRLSESISAFQKSRRGTRKGKPTGWPKFRSHKQKPFSLLYDEPNKGFKFQNKTLFLSLGRSADNKSFKLKIPMEKSLSAFGNLEVRQLRITKEFEQFYAVVVVQGKQIEQKEMAKVIAIDPNHKNLGVGVSNQGDIFEFSNPYFRKSIQVRIDKLKSKRDKCLRKSVKKETENGKSYYVSSKRWNYLNNKLEKLYRVRREQIKTYLYSYANFLFSNFDLVSVGDYTPKGGGINKGMRRSMNNESVIGNFKNVLSWVAQKSGKSYMEWKEYNSTKTCSDCNSVLPKSIPPNIREWRCSHCGTHHHRDVNAARNGLHRTLDKLEAKKLLVPCSGQFENEFSGCIVNWNGAGLDIVSKPGIVPSAS